MKYFKIAIFAILFLFAGLAFSQSLVYQSNFEYPDSLKKRQGSFDTKWAVDLGITTLYLVTYERNDNNEYIGYKFTALIGGNGVGIIDSVGRIFTMNKQDFQKEKFTEVAKFFGLESRGFYLSTLGEAPRDYAGYTDHEKGQILEKDFYAFTYGEEVWVLHRGFQVRCDCPSQVIGYSIYPNGNKEMLRIEKLRYLLSEVYIIDNSD